MRKNWKFPKMSVDDLTWAVESSTALIALMWMVHQWEPTTDLSNKPLDLQYASDEGRLV
jgi:hypothetical protein